MVCKSCAKVPNAFIRLYIHKEPPVYPQDNPEGKFRNHKDLCSFSQIHRPYYFFFIGEE
jgi:hypothetical protein